MMIKNKNLVLVIVFSLFTFVFIFQLSRSFFTKKEGKIMELNVAFVGDSNIKSFDTRKISNQSQTFLLRNLFSPLVDYDKNGQLVTAIAERFWWENDSLIFSFGENTRASNGTLIAAEDAAISIKRLIKDGNNKHGDIGLILCENNIDRSKIFEFCPGITVKDGNLILTPTKKEYKDYLLPLLASVDFRIFPKASLDSNFDEIVDYSITSGPYFVSEIYPDKFVLRANKHSYLFNENIADTVNLLFVKATEVVELFNSNKIDLIPSNIPLNKTQYFDLENSNKEGIDIFKTYNLKIFGVFFTDTGLTDFTADERFYTGKALIEPMEKARGYFNVNTSEFFQDFGEGYLNDSQLKTIERLRESQHELKFKRKIRIAVTKMYEDRWAGFFEKYPMFEKVLIDTSPIPESMMKFVDAYIVAVDVAFNSSPSLLAFSLKQGYFGIYKDNLDLWFRNYINLGKNEQLNELNTLHFNSLKNCNLYPVTKAPYIAISKKPWKIDLNKYFAATNLWQIYKN